MASTTADALQPSLPLPIVRKWYERPSALPTDFIGTPAYTERLPIIGKKEGLRVYTSAVGPYGGGGISMGEAQTAYFIFVLTPHGDMRIEVSKEVFGLLRINEEIIVRYRKGRWTGTLKGKIAR